MSITLLDAWAKYKERKLAPKTISDMACVLNIHCSDLLYCPLSELCTGEGEERVLALFRSIKAKSVAQAIKAARYLRAIINYASIIYKVREWKVNNPVCAISPTGEWESLEPRDSRLEEQDFPLFFAGAATRSRSEFVWLVLLLLTGLRREALAAARWSWIDFRTGTLTVPASVEKNRHKHVVALSAYALDLLARLYARQRNPQPLGPVFAGLDSNCYAQIRDKYNISCRPHDLRRTYASVLSELGYGEIIVKRMLNHRDKSVTFGYVHLSVAGRRAINEAVTRRILELAYPAAVA